MTTFVAGSSVDMTTWAFSPGWKGTAHSASSFTIAQNSTGKVDTFTGSGFGGYDSHGFPTLGTITGITFAQNGTNLVTLSDFSMSVSDERAFAGSQDMAGFQNALFSGDDDFTDSTGSDHMFGLGGNDVFHMTHGGTDIVEGDDGNDTFDFGGSLVAADTVDGGNDFDTVNLDGDYSAGLVLGANTVTNVEQIVMADGNDYNLTMNDGNVASGQSMTIDASALTLPHTLTFDGSAEQDGSFTVDGGEGNDTITGGHNGDTINAGDGNDTIDGGGGPDVVHAGAGNDLLTFGDHLGSGSMLDGGDGFDEIDLNGDYSAGVHFQMTSVESVNFTPGHEYSLTLDAGSMSDGGTTTVHAENMNAGDNVTFDGSHVTQGSFNMIGGAGNDHFIGGSQADTLSGGEGGSDVLQGGGGDDTLTANRNGTTDMQGGSGNDTFVINGGIAPAPIRGGHGTAAAAAGGGADVNISDDSGHDTIDMRDATGPANIDMATGGTVGSQTVSIAPSGSESDKSGLDISFVQDVTGSFGDDLTNVRSLLPNIISSVDEANPDTRFAVTSFGDKPAEGSPYEYETNQALTTDTDAIQAAYNSLSAGGGGDTPEASLDALQQVALRGDEVGWGSGRVHVTVLLTDAAYHFGGDGTFPGLPANNGDAVLDGDPPGSGEDYASVDQMRDALLSEDIIPIFAVTSDVASVYQDLVSQLGFGTVITLASDSSNIIDAINNALNFVSQVNVIEDAQGTHFGDDITGNDADNSIWGNDGNDNIQGGNGNDTLRGGSGKDHIFGGNGDDRLAGGAGKDLLDGGEGADTYHFATGVELNTIDTIEGFNALEDKIDVPGTVLGIDRMVSGHGHLGRLANADHLAAHHALLVELFPGHGGDAVNTQEGGTLYLVVDVNGVAGYQHGSDLAVKLTDAVNMDQFSLTDFT